MAFSKSMDHYQQACREHPELLIDDKKFERMIGIVQDFYRGEEGISSPYVFPFHVIKGAILYVVDNIVQTAKEIVAYKQEEIGGSGQILELVRSYFKLCQTTLDSLRKLQVSLGGCINKLMAVLHRDRPAEEVKKAVGCAEGVTDDFFLSLPHLIGKHVDMLTALQQARDKDMPIRAASPVNRTARKLTTTILVTVFTAAVAFSILAAAFYLSPVLAALPVAVISIASWGPFLEWVDRFCIEAKEGRRRRREKRVSLGKKKRNVAMQELEEIKLLTDNTTVSFSRFNITPAEDRKGAVPLDTLLKNMAELKEQMEKGSSDIRKAKLNLFKKITEPSRRRDRARFFLYRQAAVMEEKKEKFFEKMSEKFDNFPISRRS